MLVKFLMLAALPGMLFGQWSTAWEGKPVTAKMDFPATQEGVDLHMERERLLDTGSYDRRIRQYGVAVAAGQTIVLTKVKVKDKTIELHLGEGGYGTFWDERETPSVSTNKSSRERSLESQLRSEKDSSRRRSIESSLRYERLQRQRREERERDPNSAANVARKQRVTAKRLAGGSRLNLKFESEAASKAASPEQIQRLLAAYLDFGSH
jgi:hypothetical protein